MTAALIEGPEIEPVSLEEAKAHLRIDTEDEDELLAASIMAARLHVETATRRKLVAQRWRIYLDGWPKGRIVRLPVAPLISVDAVTVYDADGEPVTVPETDYAADAVSTPPRLSLSGAALPPVRRALNGIEIDVTAGYGPAAADVPSPLRQAILMLVAHWHEHRAAAGEHVQELTPFGFAALTAPYGIPTL